jgi:phospholipid N-methyltransferase
MSERIILNGYWHFFWAGITKQLQTGTVLPCQGFVLHAMAAPIPETYDGVVLELGAGIGSLTVRLAERCPRARILACEINPVLAEDARRNLVRAGINGNVQVLSTSAEQLVADLNQKSTPKPGYIVSGLPLGNLGRKTVTGLLQAIRELLPPDGMFIQVQHFLFDRKRIQAFFPNLRIAWVMLNVLPIFVFYAQKAGGERA